METTIESIDSVSTVLKFDEQYLAELDLETRRGLSTKWESYLDELNGALVNDAQKTQQNAITTFARGSKTIPVIELQWTDSEYNCTEALRLRLNGIITASGGREATTTLSDFQDREVNLNCPPLMTDGDEHMMMLPIRTVLDSMSAGNLRSTFDILTPIDLSKTSCPGNARDCVIQISDIVLGTYGEDLGLTDEEAASAFGSKRRKVILISDKQFVERPIALVGDTKLQFDPILLDFNSISNQPIEVLQAVTAGLFELPRLHDTSPVGAFDLLSTKSQEQFDKLRCSQTGGAPLLAAPWRLILGWLLPRSIQASDIMGVPLMPATFNLGQSYPYLDPSGEIYLPCRNSSEPCGTNPNYRQPVIVHLKDQSEFITIENRSPTELEPCLPGDGGLLVFHVDFKGGWDEAAARSVPEDVTWAEGHHVIRLIPADGLHQIQRFDSNHGDYGDPWQRGTSIPLDYDVDRLFRGRSLALYRDYERNTRGGGLTGLVFAGGADVKAPLLAMLGTYKAAMSDICRQTIRSIDQSEEVFESMDLYCQEMCLSILDSGYKQVFVDQCSMAGYIPDSMGMDADSEYCLADCVADHVSQSLVDLGVRCEATQIITRDKCKPTCEGVIRAYDEDLDPYPPAVSGWQRRGVGSSSSILVPGMFSDQVAECVGYCQWILSHPTYFSDVCGQLSPGYKSLNAEQAGRCTYSLSMGYCRLNRGLENPKLRRNLRRIVYFGVLLPTFVMSIFLIRSKLSNGTFFMF